MKLSNFILLCYTVNADVRERLASSCKGGGIMTTFESLSLMIAFGMLVAFLAKK